MGRFPDEDLMNTQEVGIIESKFRLGSRMRARLSLSDNLPTANSDRNS